LPEEAVVFLDDIFLRLGARHWEGDPKALVDMRLKHTAMEVKKIMYAREHQLENSREMWEAFMAWGFEKDFHFTPTPPEGSNKHTASAWVHFEQDLRERWDQLTASFPPAQFTSRIAVPNPVVVPGGRFNESYYWDSYWIIEGLLRSDRVELARGIVENFAALIHAYGFVPNGTRIYYTNRSQPPMLAEMVLAILAARSPAAVYSSTLAGHPEAQESKVQRIARESVRAGKSDVEWVTHLLPALNAEYDWWMTHRLVEFGPGLRLNAYSADADRPRPESYPQDLAKGGRYKHIIAACESGWDFSSRWVAAGRPLTNMGFIDTANVIPVDLNCILFRMEVHLSAWYAVAGFPRKSIELSGYAEARADAMEYMRVSESDSERFRDLDRATAKPRDGTYASDFWPMWAGLLESDSAVKALINSGLLCEAGVQCSTVPTGEQWDAPNVWAPLQHIIVLGLRRIGTEAALRLAAEIALRFQRAVVAEWQASGELHEKYGSSGAAGRGGEYEPQVGFGWTNGVCLHFIDLYGYFRTARRSSVVDLPPNEDAFEDDFQMTPSQGFSRAR
jgi:alpha,alpha-trehalase